MGIDENELTGLNDVTTAECFEAQKGPVIGIFHEYVLLGKVRSIHAAGQIEWFNCKVEDRSKVVGDPQRIETHVRYVFPFSNESGWFICTQSRSLLMMAFSNIPMSSSHQLSFGMLLFWTMALHLPFLRKFTK